MRLTDIPGKARRRFRSKIVTLFRGRPCYPKLYRSYWHCRFSAPVSHGTADQYYAAVPHRGAGIGHQLANWIAGYWFARQLGLRFAHTPFASPTWEHFLGFGDGETKVSQLLDQGYKRVRLPLFDEFNAREVELQRQIIASYGRNRVVFVAEQDQFYRDQFGVMDDLKRKFHGAPARQADHLIYSPEQFNIAVHVRRGDIAGAAAKKNANLQMRWQDAGYFVRVLTAIGGNLQTSKPVVIHLFSQGTPDEFQEFKQFRNLRLCLDMSAQESFLHMVRADLLITSKSGFSYKPALLSNGIKICPRTFWHGYPQSPDWILAEEDGTLPLSQFRQQFNRPDLS